MALVYEMYPQGVGIGVIGAQKPNTAAGDLASVRGSIAHRTDKDGVLVEEPINKARADYSKGSCPSLLTEPQEQTTIGHSENITAASWSVSGCTRSVNTSISPKGDLTMDTLFENTSTGQHSLQQGEKTIVADTQQILSVYFRKVDGSAQRYLRVQLLDSTFTDGGRALFDIETGEVAAAAVAPGTGTNVSSGVNYEGNGIYRAWLSVNLNNGHTTARPYFYLQENGTTYVAGYTGDGVSGVQLWGANLGGLGVLSSYIENNGGGTVVRAADTGIKTGDISSYINSEEGVIEINCAALFKEGRVSRISLCDDSFDNRISLSFDTTLNKVTVFFQKGGSTMVGAFVSTISDVTDFNTFKIGWKNGQQGLKVNGVEVDSDTVADTFAASTLTHFKLSSGGDTADFAGYTNYIKIYNSFTNY